jgi:hypothetical protein
MKIGVMLLGIVHLLQLAKQILLLFHVLIVEWRRVVDRVAHVD